MAGLFSMENHKKVDIKDVLATMTNAIGHDRWFIAGSYAHTSVKDPSDIDIFFLSEHDHAPACDKVGHIAARSGYSGAHATEAAMSFYLGSVQKRIQLISKHYGTPEEVFNTFDINVCKRAILPNGEYIIHPSALTEINIEKLNSGTFKRYFKYIYYLDKKNQLEKLGKELIDNYIGDSTIIVDFYKGKDVSEPANRALFKEVVKHFVLQPYAYEQAVKYAPELLI